MTRAIGIGIGMPFGGGAASSPAPYFPRTRNEYGLVYSTYPAAMANSPVQDASLPTIDTFSVPAGVGKTYAGVPTVGLAFPAALAGAKIVFWITIDNPSTDYNTPTVRLISATLGTQTLDLVEEVPGTWVYEATVPASGYSSILMLLTSASASNAVTGSAWKFAISPVGASSASPRTEVAMVDAWAATNYGEGHGNLWPIEKQTLAIISGDTLEAYRGGNGITIDPSEDVLVLVKIETTAGGTPAIVDRMYMRALMDTPSDSENVFLFPLAEYPGVWGLYFKYSGMSGPSVYLELNVDNAQTGAWYTQEAVTVTAIQVYKNPPATISDPALLSYAASDGIVVRNFDGLLDVYTPMFASTGNVYMQWQCRRYDTTGNPAGGGVGEILEDVYYTRRSGSSDFCPVYNLTDVGLNEFSMKKDDGTNEHVGHDVHGGQARRASPLFEIDSGSGWVAQTADAREDFINVDKARWTEYSEVYDRLDGTTVLANLDTVKTWEGSTLKMAFSLELLVEVDFLVCFMGMFSPYANIDNNGAVGALFSTITMPNQGGASYTPGSGINATYPAEKRFTTTSTFGIDFDIEVQGTPPTEFRSWVQSGGGSRKFYFSVVGQRDSFGLIGERTALTLPLGTILTQEVWITATK